jgi:hypothetical protein
VRNRGQAWMVSVTLGEFAGFCVPALVGATVAAAPASVMITSLTIAGAVEGAVLGFSQARVLRRVSPALSSPRWITGTALGAALAWLVGMIPSTLPDRWSRWPAPVLVVLAAALATVLLCSIGVAQWLELRRVVGGSDGRGMVCRPPRLRRGDDAALAAGPVDDSRHRDRGFRRTCHGGDHGRYHRVGVDPLARA